MIPRVLILPGLWDSGPGYLMCIVCSNIALSGSFTRVLTKH